MVVMVVMGGYGGWPMRTCFRDGDGQVRERDETHWRSYDEGRLDPWVIGLEFLNWVHRPALAYVVVFLPNVWVVGIFILAMRT